MNSTTGSRKEPAGGSTIPVNRYVAGRDPTAIPDLVAEHIAAGRGGVPVERDVGPAGGQRAAPHGQGAEGNGTATVSGRRPVLLAMDQAAGLGGQRQAERVVRYGLGDTGHCRDLGEPARVQRYVIAEVCVRRLGDGEPLVGCHDHRCAGVPLRVDAGEQAGLQQEPTRRQQRGTAEQGDEGTGETGPARLDRAPGEREHGHHSPR
ncbi:hypothetical protein ACQPXM_21730 [Kribbella sp. CA-253562]|uniref:hypothetical protein n=1 Tax=Kribbella sp. CA-253562 TaxID=3239942 RepID=UPI003D89F707